MSTSDASPTAVPRRILVLDDDAALVEFLCEALDGLGYESLPETAPQAALKRIQSESFDLVLTDVEMPGLRGTALLTAILAARPAQLVLLMSAFGSIELAVSAVRAGACDFIPKPFKIEALQFAIERAFKDRQMHREIVRLRTTRAESDGDLVAQSPAMQKAISTARRAARSPAVVLLTGETGTGKTSLARHIHDLSTRRDAPFKALNCASLPLQLVESELFGARRGAFTDAREDRPGLFLAANRGTVFLDEVGELPLEVQAKLLHVIEANRVRAVGATTDTVIDTRVVAATNQNLETLVKEGRFRSDLYYRLNVIRIEVPPLRERREDIVPLVDRFLAQASERNGRQVIGLSTAAMRALVAHDWPGNVRELVNTVERAVALTEHDVIVPEDLGFPAGAGAMAPSAATAAVGSGAFIDDGIRDGLSLTQVEKAYTERVLAAHGGNKAAAARVLGINRRTLYRIIEEE